MDVTHGTLLGGRVRYVQFRTGYRTGIEPVLLAAAVPAQAGQRVLEAGTGAGAGLLCLLRRVAGVTGTGIELDPELADLARQNVIANDLPATIHTGTVAEASSLGSFDHVFANPPWHDQAGTAPADARRALATHRARNGLGEWTGALSKCLGRHGTLTLALPAAHVAEAIALLYEAGLKRVTIIPLWPGRGVEAKVVLLQGGFGREQSRIAAGLTLHEHGRYTEAAEAVLRHAGPLRY